MSPFLFVSKTARFLFECKLTYFTDGVVLINKVTALVLSEMLYIL